MTVPGASRRSTPTTGTRIRVTWCVVVPPRSTRCWLQGRDVAHEASRVGASDRSTPGATLRDVAGAAGVSIATVSRILTGARNSAPATRERVLTAAAALDYRPSGPARALKLRRSRTLGLLGTDIW